MIKLKVKSSNFISKRSSKNISIIIWEYYKYRYLTGEEILPSNQRQLIEQAKFAYSPLGKAFEKQTEKQVGALKSVDLSDEKDELKQIAGIFPQHFMNYLIRIKLKEIVKLEDVVKKDDQTYKSKRGKIIIILLNIHCLLFFERYT